MSDEKDIEDVDSPNNEDENTKSSGEDGDTPAADAGESEDESGSDNESGEVDDDAASDDPNELREKLEESEKKNKRLFERTMKAEGKVKDPKTGKWVKKDKPKPTVETKDEKQPDDLSSRDVIALMKAGITVEEDIDEVKDYAKLKGLTIAEAIKSTVVKTILSEKTEERKTATATNTGKSRRSNTKVSVQEMTKKASETGELPESDEDMAALADAQLQPRNK